MKKNKIIIFSALLIFAVNCLYSQKISIVDGYVQQRATISAFGEKYPSYYHGRKSGVNIQLDYKNNFSLLTGALYSVVYSSNLQGFQSDSIYTGKVRTYNFGHSIDVPIRAKYSLELPKDWKLFAFAGPNVNIGIAMTQRVEASISPEANNLIKELLGRKYETGTEDLYKSALIHRINFQLGVGGGAQWKKYQIQAGYDFGVNNLSRMDSHKLRTGGWWVSLAYQF